MGNGVGQVTVVTSIMLPAVPGATILIFLVWAILPPLTPRAVYLVQERFTSLDQNAFRTKKLKIASLVPLQYSGPLTTLPIPTLNGWCYPLLIIIIKVYTPF